MGERGREDLILVGRPNRHPDRRGGTERCERPDDHAFVEQGVKELTGVSADIEEEEVRHRRLGHIDRQGRTGPHELAPGGGRDLASAHQLGIITEARQRSVLSGLIDVERVPHLADRLDDICRADPVPDPKARKPVDLRERPEYKDAAPVALQVLLDPVRIPGLLDVLEVSLVENGQEVARYTLEVRVDRLSFDHRPGRVVGVTEVDDLGSRRHLGEQSLRVVAVLDKRHSLHLGSHLDRVEDVARERRPPANDLISGIEGCEREVADDAVGAGCKGDLGGFDPVARCQGFPQPEGAAVRVAVQVSGPTSEGLERAREGPELALVRCKLYDPVKPEVALDLLHGPARLVRHQIGDRRAKEWISVHNESLELLPPGHRVYPLRVDEIGLFQLELVLLPGEQRPLHIFEPRYRELIGECLETGDQFGLVLSDEDGLREIGTRAAVVEVLEHFDDGRLNIVIEGVDRFRLVELTEGHSYATAEVDDLVDEGDGPTEDERERVLAAYDKVLEAAQAELDELDPATESLAFEIGARIELGNEIKQDLLELRSERERVVRLEPILTRAAEAVLRERTVRERASGNGRVEPVP